MKRPRGVFAGLAAIALLVMALTAGGPGGGAAAGTTPSISAAEAGAYVGEYATVCGVVKSAAYFSRSKGRPTFLNLGKPYPDQPFTVVIWGSTRDLFERSPEALFDGRRICVTGTIVTYQGRPQIVVDDPGQIELAEKMLPIELSYLEKLFVKVVMASLGQDVNYGSGDWDEETSRALTEFQDAEGLEPTGLPDAATLRALAEGVTEMPVDDQTMIIRLLLFNLAQREG
jgi:hypothetical protein